MLNASRLCSFFVHCTSVEQLKLDNPSAAVRMRSSYLLSPTNDICPLSEVNAISQIVPETLQQQKTRSIMLNSLRYHSSNLNGYGELTNTLHSHRNIRTTGYGELVCLLTCQQIQVHVVPSPLSSTRSLHVTTLVCCVLLLLMALYWPDHQVHNDVFDNLSYVHKSN